MSDILVESPQVLVTIDGPQDGTIDVASPSVAIGIDAPSHAVSVASTVIDTTVDAFQSANINVLGVPSEVDAVTELPSINIEVVGGGGGSVEKQFRTVDLVMNIPSGQATSSIVGGKQFFILGYTSTVAGIWIRGYADEASRTADIARPHTSDPDLNAGVVFELITEVGSHLFSVPVTAYGNPTLPLLIESVFDTPIDTTVTFSIY